MNETSTPDLHSEILQRFLDRVDAKLLSSADKAADKIIQLMNCGNPNLEMMAAKLILKATTRVAETNQLKKLVRELQQASASLTKQVTKLQKDSDELSELKTHLKKGTLSRPTYLTQMQWEKLIKSTKGEQEIPVAYVDKNPNAAPHNSTRYVVL